ncbi:MAG: hypothetical protein ACI38U_00275 [Corynebacterium sp.]|uniref:hypothetical protein n=1 Tax=Corynebacterium sp. TaxID=1720 RepID=UPI003F0B9AB9
MTRPTDQHDAPAATVADLKRALETRGTRAASSTAVRLSAVTVAAASTQLAARIRELSHRIDANASRWAVGSSVAWPPVRDQSEPLPALIADTRELVELLAVAEVLDGGAGLSVTVTEDGEGESS